MLFAIIAGRKNQADLIKSCSTFLFYFIASQLAILSKLSFDVILSAVEKPYSVLAIRISKWTQDSPPPGPIAAEQMLSAIHGIFEKLSFLERLFRKKQEKVSFEIANIGRQIKFYIWFSPHLRNFIEGQIYAQYPDIEIEEVSDYSFKNSEALVSGACLGFEEPDIFPIKRYPQFEDKLTRIAVDPMAGITSALSKLLLPEDEAWIQIVIRPLADKWRVLFIKCLRILGKGIFGNIERLQKLYCRMFCTRKLWPRILFFPLYIFFWLQGILSGMRKLSLEKTSERHLSEEMSRSHEKETELTASLDKVTKLLFEATIRILYLSKNKDTHGAGLKVKEIAGAFKQFNIPHLNGFKFKNISTAKNFMKLYQQREIDRDSLILNNEELATIYHLPTTVQTPNIAWVRSKKLEPPVDLPTSGNTPQEELAIFGMTNFRQISQTFGMKKDDRRRHIYIIGKTGMGKSTLLENMLFADIRAGKGVAVVDPHGDLADKVIDFIPSHRTNDVILFDASDRDYPIAFNMLENIDSTMNSIVASGLVGIFKKLYAESWGPRLEHILRNTILALLEYPNTTMLGITRILQDSAFRRQVIKKIKDPIVKAFWINEFEKMDPRFRIEAISPILNKVGQFLASSIIRNIVGQPKSSVDLYFAMNHKKIVIINLSKGKIGEDSSALLGSMMITKFQLDAMRRANMPENERVDFYLYVDEFQNFATESFATILSEARKYRLSLTMANQYITQMPEEVRDAVFGNVGTLISFQVGFDDTETIAGQFGDEASEPDLVSLPVGHTYIRLLIDGMPTKVFSMTTFKSPQFEKEAGRREKIIKMSRERYAKKRELVEDKIYRWTEKGLLKEEERNTKAKK